MSAEAKRLDGAAAALLTRTIDSFTRQLSDETRFSELLARLGVTGDAVEVAASTLKGAEADIAGVATATEAAVTELTSGHRDWMKLVGPMAAAWQSVTGLIDTVGSVSLPTRPSAASRRVSAAPS